MKIIFLKILSVRIFMNVIFLNSVVFVFIFDRGKDFIVKYFSIFISRRIVLVFGFGLWVECFLCI